MSSGDNQPNVGGAEPAAPDPYEIRTRAALAGAFNLLCAGRSYSELNRAVGGTRANSILSSSTLSDLINGRSIPSRETLLRFLTACGVAEPEQKPWLDTCLRLASAQPPRPPGAVRVRDADPRQLGVRASIQDRAGELPRYVARDIDDTLRSLLRTGSEGRGSFVLIMGAWSVGTSRTAFEAIQAEAEEWWLVHPSDAAALEALASTALSRTVVWLDEIQRYLDDGLTAAAIRALRGLREPPLIVGTVWAQTYHRFVAGSAHDNSDRRQRDVLTMATILTLGSRLSAAERVRATTEASTDPRLAQVLDSPHGVVQALAAGPELIHRWVAAPDPYAEALITAAVDARRMGVHSPVPTELLRDAVPGYLSPVERARASADWFTQALAYATEDVAGAIAAVMPAASEMGVVTGYLAAGFLLQYGNRTREMIVPPDSAWTAYGRYLGDSEKIAVAEAAYLRGRDKLALRLLETAMGHPIAQERLDELRGKRAGFAPPGPRQDSAELIDTCREAADAGEPGAYSRLAALYQEQDLIDEALEALRAAVVAGEERSRTRLAEAYQRLGVDDALEAWRDAVAADEPDARAGLADLLREQGRTAEALTALRAAVEAGEPRSRSRLAELCQELGCGEEAIRVRRAAVAAGEPRSRSLLAETCQRLGHYEEALDAWNDAAAAGEPGGWLGMTAMLQQLGRPDDAVRVWRDAVFAGEPDARSELADLLGRSGRVDEAEQVWRDAVAAGVAGARARLAEFRRRAHPELGPFVQVWQEAVAAGEPGARSGLAHLLGTCGYGEAAEDAWRDAITAGEPGARSGLAALLEKRRNEDKTLAAWEQAVAAGEYGARSHLIRLRRKPQPQQVRPRVIALQPTGRDPDDQSNAGVAERVEISLGRPPNPPETIFERFV